MTTKQMQLMDSYFGYLTCPITKNTRLLKIPTQAARDPWPACPCCGRGCVASVRAVEASEFLSGNYLAWDVDEERWVAGVVKTVIRS